jgi:hypothetical protein
MSWTDLMSPWTGQPAPDPLRVKILGAFAYSVLDLRERIAGDCADCGEELCPGHAAAADLADGFEHAYMQVAAGSREWCNLAVTLISEMN